MRKSGRLTLWTWHVPVAIAVVLAVLIVTYVVIPRNRLDRRLGALRAAGYPTTYAELARYNGLPEGTPNPAPTYERAFAAFVPPVEEANIPFFGKAEIPDRGMAFSEPVAKAVSQFLAANQDCLALLHEAAGIEDCRYTWDYTDPVNGVPQWKSLKSCARLLQLRAAADVYAGDVDSALAHIKDQLQLGRSLCREPGAVNYLMRIACYGRALDGLERTLNATSLSDQQLADLTGTMSSTKSSLDLRQAIVTERCLMIELCRYPGLREQSGPIGAFLRILSDKGIAGVLDYASALLEATKLPSVRRLARFQELSDEADERPPSFRLDLLGTWAMAPLYRVAQIDARVSAYLDLARTALAIERYRLATGKVPERLEELIPQYLREVPVDPFDGSPIRYRRADRGYLLYSIDLDGQDNTGREKTEVNSGEPYDLSFVVAR